MRITIAKVASQLGDIGANLVRADQIVTDAGREDGDLLVFPELFVTGDA